MQRVDILRLQMNCKNVVREDCSGVLDLDDAAMKTEGYLPRDLNLLLDRAIHASVVHNRVSGNAQGKHWVKFQFTVNVRYMYVYLKVYDVPQVCVWAVQTWITLCRVSHPLLCGGCSCRCPALRGWSRWAGFIMHANFLWTPSYCLPR